MDVADILLIIDILIIFVKNSTNLNVLSFIFKRKITLLIQTSYMSIETYN